MTESVQNALSGTDLTTKENPIEIAFANKKTKTRSARCASQLRDADVAGLRPFFQFEQSVCKKRALRLKRREYDDILNIQKSIREWLWKLRNLSF